MKKRQLADDLDDALLRISSLESRIEIRNEKRDGEIALLKAAHEAVTYWRERHEALAQREKATKEERDGFSQQAKELRGQLDRVASVRDVAASKTAEYWKTKCLEVAAERDEIQRQLKHATAKQRVPPRKAAAKKRGKR
jgi:uncharacterized coiled-coil DUF342 family protein